jgi:hypothetical protein
MKIMYFWNIEALKSDIKRGEFTDREAISYIVVSLFLYSLGTELIVLFPAEAVYNVWDGVNSLLNIIIPVVGTLYAYKKNGGASGRDFANKYFSIGFVMGIRFLVYLIGVIFLLVIYWSFVVPDEVDTIPTTWVEVLLFSGWYAMLYYKIGEHIGEIVSKKE